MTQQWKPELRRWRNRREPVVIDCLAALDPELRRRILAFEPKGSPLPHLLDDPA